MPPFTDPDNRYDPTAGLVRVNPVPSLIVDMESLHLVVVNQAACSLLGYSEPDLMGKSLLDLVPAEDIARVQQAADKPPPEGETSWRAFRKDRTLRYVKVKYPGDIYRNKPARFIVVLEASEKAF